MTDFNNHAEDGNHHFEEATAWLLGASIEDIVMAEDGAREAAERDYMRKLAEAQVHATLAVAKYTAELAEQTRIGNLLSIGAIAPDHAAGLAPAIARTLRIA